VRPQREHLVVTAIWLLGLASLASVLVLQGRLDQRRHAQLAVASLRVQVGALPKVALGLTGPHSRPRVEAELTSAEQQIGATAETLNRFAGNRSDSRLIMSEAGALYPLLSRANTIASSGHLRAATVLLGLALLPGAPGYRLNETFGAIGTKYDHEASSARELAEIGSVFAIVLLLLAFSAVLWHASRLAREKNQLLEQSRQDALTDQLTGLWNRRKLFTDLDALLARPRSGDLAVLAVLDLDGFKAYNDRFGHPAGDALLSRIGQRLRSAVDGQGTAYRMGGDEFCLIAQGEGAEAVLERAQASLTERVGDLTISASLGSTPLTSSTPTADDAIREADQRLYDHKRSARSADPADPPSTKPLVAA
jgi:diguanylate cyclase (GGDEF)-like protein